MTSVVGQSPTVAVGRPSTPSGVVCDDPLLSAMRTAVVVADSVGDALYMNPSAACLLDSMGGGQGLGMDGGELPDWLRMRVAGFLDGELETQTFTRAVSVNGSEMWLEVHLGVIDHGARRSAALVEMCEATLPGRCTAGRDAALDAMQFSHRLSTVGSLIRGTMHEVNNLLTVVVSYAELLTDLLPPGHKDATYAEQIVVAAGKIAGLARHLMFPCGHDTSRPQLLRVGDLLSSALGITEVVARRESIEVVCEAAPDLPLVECHGRRIRQALVNLLMNAYDSLASMGRAGGVTKRVVVRAFAVAGKGAGDVVIAVEDNGPGVPADILDSVFDPFFTTKSDQGRLGLGLSISRRIISAYGGSLSLESGPGGLTRAVAHLRAGQPSPDAMSTDQSVTSW